MRNINLAAWHCIADLGNYGPWARVGPLGFRIQCQSFCFMHCNKFTVISVEVHSSTFCLNYFTQRSTFNHSSHGPNIITTGARCGPWAWVWHLCCRISIWYYDFHHFFPPVVWIFCFSLFSLGANNQNIKSTECLVLYEGPMLSCSAVIKLRVWESESYGNLLVCFSFLSLSVPAHTLDRVSDLLDTLSAAMK